ncbi:NUDIX domain-containing protein [Streptomyces chrestomyceticus]|uniref:NUDIX domain-containing protein n=1 Tax=Streptomyces chrestomyceticus TaxID=68185 RepID=UPI0037BC21C7
MGVAAAIRNSDGAFLLHLRDNIDGICWPGHWSFLGGQLEDGETPSEAITRELREEAGLVLPDLRPLATVHQGNGRADIEVFAASWDGDAARIQVTEGIMLAWFHPRLLPRLRVPPWCVEAISLHQAEAQQADAEEVAGAGHRGPPTG